MRYEITYNKEDSLKVLGLLVKFHRLRNSFSLRDLGTLSNISHTLISNVENGKVVSNDETLKDLFQVLSIEFQNKKEIFNEFKPLYEKLFDYLYNYEFEKATEVYEIMQKRDRIYSNSNVLVDYHLIKYLYLAMLDKLYGEYESEYMKLRAIATNLTQKQNQLFHLIHGIYLVSRGLFFDASKELEKAVVIGDSTLDPFVKIYMIRAYVKMYRFMDAQRLARESIPGFEIDLNYTRAMEIRVIISYTFILVRKYKEAIELLDKVYRFANLYNAQLLMDECNLYYSVIHIQKNETKTAKMKLNSIKKVTNIVLLYKTLIARSEEDYTAIREIYSDFIKYNEKKPSRRFEYAFEVVAASFKIVDYSDDDYLRVLEQYVAFGIVGSNLEVIEIAYGLLIEYYKNKRMYKKAFEASEHAREIRRFGVDKT